VRNGVTDPYTWDLVKIMTGTIVLCMFGGAASLATAQDTKNNTHKKTRTLTGWARFRLRPLPAYESETRLHGCVWRVHRHVDFGVFILGK